MFSLRAQCNCPAQRSTKPKVSLDFLYAFPAPIAALAVCTVGDHCHQARKALGLLSLVQMVCAAFIEACGAL